MQIFLARDNKQAGPYTLEQLNTMLTSGQVKLSDLAWHEGMESWLPLHQITGGQLYYTGTPATSDIPPASPEVQPIQNAEIQKRGMNSQGTDELKLAEVGTRIGAKVIDQLLFFLCLLPALPYLNSLDSKGIKIEEQSTQIERMTALQQLLIDVLPQTVMGFIVIASLALLILQIFLLISKGQTIGKLILGIRIVDYESNKVPNAFNIIGLRTLLTEFIYILAVPLFMLIDTIAMFISPENRSLHDRMAKTKVLIAHDDQLDKTNAS